MQSARYLLIDSRDRISGTSNNFRITLKPGYKMIKRVKLLAVVLPLTNYIIDSNNNLIYFSDGTNKIATIQPGVYDYQSITTAINTAFQNAAYTGVMNSSYSTTTLSFTLTGTTAFSLLFGTNTLNSAAYILGFNNADTSSSTVQIANNASNLSLPPYFYINIDNFVDQITTSNGDFCTFLIMTQNISSFVTFHWDHTHYTLKTEGILEPLQTLSVNLKYRNNLDFNINNTDWQMLLEFEYD